MLSSCVVEIVMLMSRDIQLFSNSMVWGSTLVLMVWSWRTNKLPWWLTVPVWLWLLRNTVIYSRRYVYDVLPCCAAEWLLYRSQRL